MNKVKTGLLVSVVIFLINGLFDYSHVLADTTEDEISRVENNLLPAVIIAGEPAFRLQDRMAHYRVPGISVTVIRDFEILWSRQYGLADADLALPVSPTTQFNVGSLSKGMASLAVLSLVNDGLVELDGDINSQLKSWKVPENEFTQQARVTPRLLMNHSGGAIFSPPVFYAPDNLPTLLQTLNGESPANTRPVTIDLVPGSQFQYSNAGFAILQQLAEDAAGEPFEVLSRERIFDPLQMTHSGYEQAPPEGVQINRAAGHQGNGMTEEIKRHAYPILAAGGLWTTTEDYARFVIELQKTYQGRSHKVISQELARQMLSPQAARQYGLGVFMRENKGEIHYFGHMGDNRGFFAGYLAHITDGYGVVIFTNSQVGAQLIREVSRSVAAVYGWEDYLPEARVVVPISNETLEAYAGTYQIGSDAAFTVEPVDGQLLLDQFGGVRLYHVGEGEFVSKFRMGSLKFGELIGGSSPGAVFNFADELGRFMQAPITAKRIGAQTLLPYQLLEADRYAEALAAYRDLKRENPDDPSVSENRLNRMGYTYLGREELDRALSVFKINAALYPDSWNCYDSMGDAYMKLGENELAIASFKRSLELNPNNQHGKLMLQKLERGG